MYVWCRPPRRGVAKLRVVTVKKSMAQENSKWLRRKGSQVLDDCWGFLGLGHVPADGVIAGRVIAE